MAHPLFTPEVRYALQANDTDYLREFCESLHPATVAETLSEEFTPEEAWKVLEQTNLRTQAQVFEYFPHDWQERMVDGTGRPHMARLIEQMSHDDRADLLRRLAPPVAESLLRLVDEADRRDIKAQLGYPEGTVGALMTTDYAWLPAGLTTAEAIDRLRQQAPDRETIYYVYILDEPTRRLLGTASLRDLILAPRHAKVDDIMERELVALNAGDDRETAARELARYDFLALPVVDADRRLVGIVTHDDVIDVIQEEATEDAQKQGGVVPITENYLEADFVTVWRHRAFWLACLFVAELLTFTALSYFEDAIASVVVLSMFIPLAISTGGNSGSQAATLITRSMALGHVGLGDWARVLRHEVLMGCALGLTLGVIGFLRGASTSEQIRGGPEKQRQPFTAQLPAGADLQTASHDGQPVYLLPAGTQLTITAERAINVTPPEGGGTATPLGAAEGRPAYSFPAGCELRTEPVNRWQLAQVIACSVFGICLWGTLIGAMLPLAFRRLGVDPALASSPFVATFVDVTGIVIFFSIAKVFLGYLM
jgi:magnesium transporter